ncbi:MAG TPA: MarR family winged helix-turn-helix transcriptional regulator [Thermomicrobiales bacterium]
MTVDEDTLIEEAVLLLPQIGRLLHTSLMSQAEAACLSLGQVKALGYLYLHGSSTIGEVAQGLGIAMPTASELVDQLVTGGWAERRVNPANRRQALVTLTPKAMEFSRRMHDARRAQVRAALSRLDRGEWPVFLRSLQALVEGLRESFPPSTPPQCGSSQSEISRKG